MAGRMLQVVRTVAELRGCVARWREAGERIGLVPTMGALHDGHKALVSAAQAGSDRVAVSIFVNPKQFGPGEDLAAYPRRETADLDMLRTAQVDLAFVPAAEEIYPPGFGTLVRVAGLTECLCGAHRPGHFDGVATVVAKLLVQALPDAAYFGEKDYQQLMVVRRMARDLDIPVQIEGVPTWREPDGLALSSRNAYLSTGGAAHCSRPRQGSASGRRRAGAGSRIRSPRNWRAVPRRTERTGFASGISRRSAKPKP